MILGVLVAAGAAALHYALPITGAIVILLTALVVSYRQVIAAFPNAGGEYAVSKAHLGTQASLVAAASLIIELYSKFTEGAWLIVLVIPGLVLLFDRVHRTYDRIGALLELGKMPKLPAKQKSLVVVPVSGISRLTAEGVSAALSLGDDVVAVTVHFADPEAEAADVSFRRQWEEWKPNVPLITLRSVRRSISRPIVTYLCQIEAEDKYHRLVVLIPEVQPPRFWDFLLFNQRGAILERAIRRGTVNVVLCRLRYRLEQFAPGDAGPAAAPGQRPGSGVLTPEDGGADGGAGAGRGHSG